MQKENPMKEIRIEKLTLNFGAGKEPTVLKKGVKLLQTLSGKTPVQTKSKHRIPSWGLRIGLPIGAKVTMRGQEAEDLFKKFLAAKENILQDNHFTGGAVSFGIHEYVDVPGAKYDPEIGIIGFQITATLERRGYRVKKRLLKNSKVGKSHVITKEDTIQFMKNKFNIKIGEEE